MSRDSTFRALLVALIGTSVGTGFMIADGPHPERAMTFFVIAVVLIFVAFAVLGVGYAKWRTTYRLLGEKLAEGNALWLLALKNDSGLLPETFDGDARLWIRQTRAVVLKWKGEGEAAVFDNLIGSSPADGVIPVSLQNARDLFKISMQNLMFIIEKHEGVTR